MSVSFCLLAFNRLLLKYMAKSDYSKHQFNIISRYYANLDLIMLGKLGELVTELYLADITAKKNRLWDRAHKAMIKLKIKPAIIEHIMSKRDVEILAKNLNDWMAAGKKS